MSENWTLYKNMHLKGTVNKKNCKLNSYFRINAMYPAKKSRLIQQMKKMKIMIESEGKNQEIRMLNRIWGEKKDKLVKTEQMRQRFIIYAVCCGDIFPL